MKISKIKVSPFGIEPKPTLLDRVKCLFGMHVTVVDKRLSETSDKIRCTKCQKCWAINKKLQIVLPWDKETEAFYNDYGDLFL